MQDQIVIGNKATDGVNMAEHHAEKIPWLGLGAEHSEITPKGALVVEHRGADGTLKGRDVFTAQDLKNALTDEGANALFAILFGATAKPAGWYIGLIRGAAAGGTDPVAGSTLANISEAAAGACPGYARSGAITWDFGTSRHARTGSRVFTASGAWTYGVTHLFLCTASSGTSGIMFNYLALSATRQPAATNDTITVSWDGSL